MSIQDTMKALACKTPDGFVDVPYMYAYNAGGLTDGSNYERLSLTLDNDTDFILRRIVGANLCVNSNSTGKFQVFDKSQATIFDAPIRPGKIYAPAGGPLDSLISGSWPVMPELVYPAGSQLGFSLYGVLRDFTAETPSIYNSQLGFWGVRRFRKGAFWTHNTNYAYHELPYTYVKGIAVNWGHWVNASGSAILNQPRRFTIPILETDFELCAIGVTNVDGSLVTTNDFQLSLVDPSGSRLLSAVPMNLPYFNFNAPGQYGNPVYPVPSLVWPCKGLLEFEITSMLPVGTSKSFVLHFQGVWRARN